jgi:tetratricopeptide (TPR) repeat protein
VPENKDIENIERVLERIGEDELDIGEIGQEEYVAREEPLPVEEGEAAPETIADLDEMLKDIEIGLTEEKELEERRAAEEAEEELPPETEEEEMRELPTVVQPADAEAALEEKPAVVPEPEKSIDRGEVLSLPGDLEIEEGPSEAVFEPVEQAPSIEIEEAEGEAEEEGVETVPVEKREEAVLEEESLDLPEDFDFGSLTTEEGPPEELAGIIPEQAEEEAPPPVEEEVQPPVEEETEKIEVPEPGELEPGRLESFEEEQLPPTVEEEAFSIEGLEIGEIEAVEEETPEEVLPEIEEEVQPQGPQEPAGGVTPEGITPKGPEPEIEISDEDTVLITAKLKQLDPTLASKIRDIIVGETLPFESLEELIELLKSDVPQTELIIWLEGATGEKVVPRMRIPEIIAVPRRPTALTRIAENLGPVVRVAGLFVVILAIVTVLFMVFVYRPMRAGRYYKEAIELLRNERYEEAETSFGRAVRIYEKVGEYDNFGWEYMLSGNYNEALQKLQEGISKDRMVKNSEIRLHLARLYNILGNHGEADRLYDIVVEKKPRVYEFKKLKGENLIDWGVEEPERLDTAYKLFREEYVEDQKNSDPLFHMLSIHLIRKDTENIDYLSSLLKSSYPRDVNKEVYTRLAAYYIDNDRIEPVRGIIAPVIQSYPDYPDAHYAFANYYKAIKNKRLQEELLKRTIEYENKRELIYPWETRNRKLLSDSYNDLGEIYAGMEIPGMSAESIRYFKKAIDENEQNVNAYFNLAQVYFYGEKNYNFARSFYENAKKMGYKSSDLKYNLGVLYYYQKRFRSALRQWSELYETMPDDPHISFAMGSALLHLGEYSSALGEFLILEERYDDLVNSLGEIKPWRAYHKRIVLEGRDTV